MAIPTMLNIIAIPDSVFTPMINPSLNTLGTINKNEPKITEEVIA